MKSLNVRTNDFPAIAVDPTDARHLVSDWQDSRHSAPGAGTYNVLVSDSTNGGATWSDASGSGTVLDGAAGEALSQPSVAVTGTGTTAVSFYRANPFTGTAVGLGDYSSIAASSAPGSNVVHAVWADTRNSSSAGPDEDVFMATVTP